MPIRCLSLGIKMNFIDLIGQRFGKQVVLERRPSTKFAKIGGTSNWLVKCDCGTEHVVSTTNLKKGFSCGCSKENFKLSGITRRLPGGQAAINCQIAKYKASALKRELGFKLSDEVFSEIIKKNCYYCGIEPRQLCTVKRSSGYQVQIKYNGIDRVDNSIGYEVDNCVPCCKICNRAKDVMSKDEFYNWISRVYEHSRPYEQEY